MSTWISVVGHDRFGRPKRDINLDHVAQVSRDEICCSAVLPLTLWLAGPRSWMPVHIDDPAEVAYVELVLRRIRFVP